ncbi:MAG: hypothetical protein R2939_10130 [Kofleriaceae bacterium]
MFVLGEKGTSIKADVAVRDAMDGTMVAPTCVADLPGGQLTVNPAAGDRMALALQAGKSTYRAFQRITVEGGKLVWSMAFDSAAAFSARQRVVIRVRRDNGQTISLFEHRAGDAQKATMASYEASLAAVIGETVYLEIEVSADTACLTAQFDAFVIAP